MSKMGPNRVLKESKLKKKFSKQEFRKDTPSIRPSSESPNMRTDMDHSPKIKAIRQNRVKFPKPRISKKK